MFRKYWLVYRTHKQTHFLNIFQCLYLVFPKRNSTSRVSLMYSAILNSHSFLCKVKNSALWCSLYQRLPLKQIPKYLQLVVVEINSPFSHYYIRNSEVHEIAFLLLLLLILIYWTQILIPSRSSCDYVFLSSFLPFSYIIQSSTKRLSRIRFIDSINSLLRK